MEKTFEQIEALWQQQDERLQRIEHVQQESVRRLLHRSITSTHRRFLIENLCAVVLGILLEIFVLSKAVPRQRSVVHCMGGPLLET